MAYYITGTLTFSNTNGRNTALAAVQAVDLGSTTTWSGGTYPAGINTSGSTGLTFSFVAPDEVEARRYGREIFDAFSPSVRNAGHLSVVRGDD
jgi:hypothetical protein